MADTAAPRAGLGFLFLAGCAWALIVLGALVRAHGAGLACPDWPLCYGQLIPRFDFRIALEWGHRLFAGLISLGLLAGSVFVWRRPALRERVGGILIVCWIALGVQIVLGGLTVLLGLAPWTVTAHLLVGSAICATLAWIGMDLRDLASSPSSVQSGRGPIAGPLAVVVGGLVVAQVAVGGLVSSHYAGLACSHFPTCNGDSIAPSFVGLIGIHVIHRLGAFALLAGFVGLVFATRGMTRVARLARLGLRLVLLQIAVGVANVLLVLPVEVTALHSALAAAIVLDTAMLVRALFGAPRAVAQHATLPGRALKAA